MNPGEMKYMRSTENGRRSPGLLQLVVLSVAVLLAAVAPATAQQANADKPDWREQYAYTLGVEAYTFGFPWVYLPQIRWLWVTQLMAS
jgi:hypothetical protein